MTKSTEQELEDILVKYASYIHLVFGVKERAKHSLSESLTFVEAKQALTQYIKQQKIKVLEQIKSELPEKRVKTNEVTYPGYDRNNPRHRYVTGVDIGHNYALYQVDNIIKDIEEEL